jgi:hypothetical protein
MRGSIVKRGKSWRIIFDVADAGGKRRQRSATVKGTYRDAQKELTRAFSDLPMVARYPSRRSSRSGNI